MPILTVTRPQMIEVAGLNPSSYRVYQSAGDGAAAFGADAPLLLEKRALVMDAVALMVRDALAKSLPRKFAAQIVRMWWDHWAWAVTYAEHAGEPHAFVQVETTAASNNWHSLVCPLGELEAQLNRFPNMRRFIGINIPDILHTAHQRAELLGADLSAGSIWLPPDHPLHVEWMQEFAAWRDRTLAEVKIRTALHKVPRPRRTTLEGITLQ